MTNSELALNIAPHQEKVEFATMWPDPCVINTMLSAGSAAGGGSRTRSLGKKPTKNSTASSGSSDSIQIGES